MCVFLCLHPYVCVHLIVCGFRAYSWTPALSRLIHLPNSPAYGNSMVLVWVIEHLLSWRWTWSPHGLMDSVTRRAWSRISSVRLCVTGVFALVCGLKYTNKIKLTLMLVRDAGSQLIRVYIQDQHTAQTASLTSWMHWFHVWGLRNPGSAPSKAEGDAAKHVCCYRRKIFSNSPKHFSLVYLCVCWLKCRGLGWKFQLYIRIRIRIRTEFTD